MHDVACQLIPFRSTFLNFAFSLSSFRRNILSQYWSLSRKGRNRLQHVINGNMFNKGKGKGKSKQLIDQETEYQNAIRAALPSAARVRMIPTRSGTTRMELPH